MGMNSLSGLEPNVQGLVHLYVGDGKGKTTSAVGLAVRCKGYGEEVLFCQFLKGRKTGEITQLEQLGIQTKRAKCGGKFVFQMDAAEKQEICTTHTQCLQEVAVQAAAGSFRLIVLDEVIDAVNAGIIPLEALLQLLNNRNSGVEIVLTGRNPAPEIVEAADYYTEFVCRKHPYQKGIISRQGVEY